MKTNPLFYARCFFSGMESSMAAPIIRNITVPISPSFIPVGCTIDAMGSNEAKPLLLAGKTAFYVEIAPQKV